MGFCLFVSLTPAFIVHYVLGKHQYLHVTKSENWNSQCISIRLGNFDDYLWAFLTLSCFKRAANPLTGVTQWYEMYQGICWETFQASSKRAFMKSYCKAVQIIWGCRGTTFSLVLLVWPCRSFLSLFLAKELRHWLSLPWRISGTWACWNWCKIFHWNYEDCHWRQLKGESNLFQRAYRELELSDKQTSKAAYCLHRKFC